MRKVIKALQNLVLGTTLITGYTIAIILTIGVWQATKQPLLLIFMISMIASSLLFTPIFDKE